MKKIAKFLCFRSAKASNLNTSESLKESEDLARGGVAGSVKLNNPKTRETIAAISQVLRSNPSFNPS